MLEQVATPRLAVRGDVIGFVLHVGNNDGDKCPRLAEPIDLLDGLVTLDNVFHDMREKHFLSTTVW